MAIRNRSSLMRRALPLLTLLVAAIGFLLAQQPPPAVTRTAVNDGGEQRSSLTSVGIEFSADVAPYLRKEHLLLRNLTTGQSIDPAVFELTYDAPTRLAKWTFPSLAAKSLAEGNYLGVLKADALVAPLINRTETSPGLGLADTAFLFHRRFGDSDGDRDVDFLDTARFRKTWNKASPAAEYVASFDANLDGKVDAFDLALFQGNYFTFFPPVAAIHASLLNDTGLSTSDGLTTDPTIAGVVYRPNPGTTFRSGLGLASAPTPSTPIDTTADLTADGTFLFTPARLAQIKGSALDPGTYRLHLETVEAGTVSSSFDVLFTLEAVVPPCDLTPAAGWITTISPATNLVPDPIPGSVRFANCEATMTEGDSFQVTLERTFAIPQNAGLLALTYEAPTFDSTSTGRMRDAFEAALVDSSGRPLNFTIQGATGVTPASSATPIVLPASPDAFFNHTDGKTPFSAPGAASVPSTINPQLSTVFIDVRHLPAGSSARLILRLVNNDRDRATTVRVTEVKFTPFDATLDLSGSAPPALSLLVGTNGTGSGSGVPGSSVPNPLSFSGGGGVTVTSATTPSGGTAVPPNPPQTAAGDSILPSDGRLIFTTTEEFQRGTLFNMNATEIPGELRLNAEPVSFPFIWIANSGEGTFSKFNTTTGKEIARYRTGPETVATRLSPSRTTADAEGNGWVGNRGTGAAGGDLNDRPGTVIKVLQTDYIDRNGNGSPDTSSDLNGDGQISGGELLPWDANADGQPDDERIALVIQVGRDRTDTNALQNYGIPRSMALDSQNNIWVGLWSFNQYEVYDGRTGQFLALVPTPVHPYGAVVDSQGRLWGATLDNGLTHINTITRTFVENIVVGGTYGITIDPDGVIWAGNYQANQLTRFDPQTRETNTYAMPGVSNSRGVAVDLNRNVWVAADSSNSMAKFVFAADHKTLVSSTSVPVGEHPTAAAVDSDGFVWTTTRFDDRAWKIDPNTNTVVFNVATGDDPYNYSDMTGRALISTVREGTWTEIIDSVKPGTVWGAVGVDANTPAGTAVRLTVRASDTRTALGSLPEIAIVPGQALPAVVGQFLQVKVTMDGAPNIESPAVREIAVFTAGPPLLTVSSPGNIFAPGSTVLLSGRVAAFQPTLPDGSVVPNSILYVQKDGTSVPSLDSQGSFFVPVEVRAGRNVFNFATEDLFGQKSTVALTLTGGVPDNSSNLTVVSGSIIGEYGRTTFHEGTRNLYADLAVRNAGTYAIRAPLYVGIANISDPSVRLLWADGVSSDGVPYYDFSAALANGELNPGAASLARTLAFYNPNHAQFTYDLVVFGQSNQAPYFTSTPPLEGVPARAYSYPSNATDPDGDTLTYSLLESPAGLTIAPATGQVSWTPTAAQLGTHDVRIRADDGKGGLAEQRYLISVITAPANRPPYFISTPVTVATVSSQSTQTEEIFDLSKWAVVQIPIGQQGPANWILSSQNTVATQTLNSDPSVLLSDIDLENSQIRGSWQVDAAASDDDYIGFVFAYQDAQHFYLFDWKRGGQNDCGGVGELGMSVKVVNATTPLQCEDLWPTAGNANRVRPLFHNSIPWVHGVSYDFELKVRNGGFSITVKQGSTTLAQIDLNDSTYASGRFGFYNNSQGPVSYTGFTRRSLPSPTYSYNADALDPDGDVLTYSFGGVYGDYRGSVLNDAPVGYWRLGEKSGTVALNTAGPSNSGTYTGALMLGTVGALNGDSDSAIAFAGGLASVPDSAELRPAALTVEAWVYPVASALYATVLTKTTTYQWGDGYGLAYYFGGINFFVNNYNGGNVLAPLPFETWTHVAGTYDGTHLRLYINGTLASSLAYTGAINHSTAPLRIGSGTGDYAWSGKLDEVALYNRALTAAEVRNHYEQGFGQRTAPAEMTINSTTGTIQWGPTAAQVGTHNVTILADDGRGGTATQAFKICVLADDAPPVITHQPADLTVSEVDPSLLAVDGQSLLATGSVSARVTNAGPGATAVPFDVLFFEDRNLNKAYDPASDTVLGRTRVTASLAADQSQVVTAAVQSLVQFSGAPVWVFVDSSDAIAETNEVNNLARPDCQATPVVGQFDPVVKWRKDSFTVLPDYNQVMMAPVVIDVNGDGIPDVVFSTFAGNNYDRDGILRAISGDDGRELWSVTDSSFRVFAGSNLAVGDIDGDGRPEIIALHESGDMIAFEHDGTIKWRTSGIWGGTAYGCPVIADIDHDGVPEIIIGGSVINRDGNIRWQGDAVGGQGRGDASFGPISIVADLDLDGTPEVVAGKSAYRANGALYWNSVIPDGFPAVGNFDGDPFPEVVVVGHGNVYLLEHSGAIKWGPVAIPGGGNGGPPTIADVDGDGIPDIGVAASQNYTVFNADGTVKWTSPTQDGSSQSTGSSVFDFDGDGKAEVVYADEVNLRIYRGSDGKVLSEMPVGSGTLLELPVIADVDGNGKADIVVIANNYYTGSPRTGIIVISDKNDTWVSTRKIWNQHSYHVTNVNDDGTIPRFEDNSWQKYNSYRLNLQPDGGALNAPDLVPSFVRASAAGGVATVTVRIGNGGLAQAPSNVSVALYNGDPRSGGVLLGTGVTTGILPPGTFEDVSITVANPNTTNLWVAADDDGTGRGRVRECNETNNFYQPGQNLPLTNQPPLITSTPVATATEGTAYQYDVEVTDADAGDTLAYSLPFAPAGMTIAGDTGLIRWTPGERDNGAAAVQVAVTDSRGAKAVQNFFIAVTDALNASPEFVSQPVTLAEATHSYFYFPTTRDPDGGAPAFDLVTSPDGMIVEADTGSLAWRPLLGQIGVHDVILRVQDGRGGVALQSFQITVAAPNSAPVFTTVPPGPAVAESPYRYVVRAQDSDGGAVTFTLAAPAPAGMALAASVSGGNSASLEWTPTLAQLGLNHVEIIARDSDGLEARQVFDLEVVASAPNRPPVFTSTPRTKTRLDLPYAYLIEATDADGDPLTFSLVASPTTMMFDPPQTSDVNTRILRWTPTPQDLGSHLVTIRVLDGRGGTTDQTFTLTVASSLENEPPQIVSNPLLQATAGQPYSYDLKATDPDGDDVQWRIVVGPVGMSLDAATGALRWSPTLDQLGNNTVTVEAADGLLATATQTWIIDVGCLNRPPGITSTPPVVAQTGAPYLYAPRASDPDGDRISWSLVANPTGMTIDAVTGLIRWTPTTNQTGATLVTLRVSDGRGGTDSQTYTLTATDVAANRPPVLVSTPSRGATAQRPYSYAVRATDPDGDTLTLTLLTAPAGATVTTTASVKGQVDGVINWTPTDAQNGPQEFIVVAKDPANASAAQRFFVTVRPNVAPTITSTPPLNAVPTVASRYDVQATDPDGDALTYALTQAPTGMSIDTLGRIVWTPTLAQIGPHNVSLTVSDGFGGSATQSYSITVGADTAPPTVNLVVAYNLVDSQGNQFVRAGTQVALTVNASDNVGVTERELRLDGVAIALNGSGGGVATFPAAGFVQAIAKARDASGNEGQTTVTIPVVDPNAASTVAVTIHTPLNDTDVTTITPVTGTITSQTTPLRDYYVEYAELNSEAGDLEIAVDDPSLSFQTIAHVTLPPNTFDVTNAQLGKFDPTMLLNGGYLIRVTAFDINGRGRREGVIVNVTGNLKLGEFRLEFPDLTVPLVGIPIEIKRIYDTRDSKKKGDFGYGWTLGLQNARILEVGKKPFAGLGGDGTTFTTKTRVYLTAPDGRRIGFKHTPQLAGAGFFFAFYRPAFTADPGIYDKLEAVPSEGAYQIRPDGSLAGGFGLVELDPEAYRLTTRDNLIYDYDQNFGLQKVTDLNGNTVTFTRDGIRHSSGVEIRFTRDAQGRITKITDPAGKDIVYAYDANGDLKSSTDRTALVTQFNYLPPAQRAHYLDEIIDPLGRRAVKTEYGPDGRIVAVIDALGNRQEQTFTPEQFTGTRTDGRGNQTVLAYNDRGNITQETDPEGGVTRYEYNDPANPDKETAIVDPLGRRTAFAYDARGNLTQQTDSAGGTTTVAYNDLDKPTAVTNALGQTVALHYDANGHLDEVTDNAGNRRQIARDAQGRVASIMDAEGNVTQFDYTNGCACGRPGKVINPDGSFRVYEYNAFGQVTKETDETGVFTRSSYDDEGKLLFTEDAQGHRTTYTYRGTLHETVTNPLGHVTRTEYDDANRQIKITDAEGGIVRFEYDADGIRTRVTDPVGNATTFVYDKTGRLKEELNTLGHKRVHTYDPAGNRIQSIDRNGRRRTFDFDALNRMTKERWWDSNNAVIRTLEYAFNDLGLRTVAQDPAARYDYTYDALNRLRSVKSTVPGLPDFTLTYTYDRNGQVTSVTDNYGVSVGSAYDARRRLARRTWHGPGIDPVRVDFAYDDAGRRTRLDRFIDLAGTQRVGHTDNAYNPLGLLRSITHKGPTENVLSSHLYTYDAANRITQWVIDGQNSTYAYDKTSQLLTADYASQPDQAYTYDRNGNRTLLGYLTGPDNQLLADGTHTYTYDPEGNMVTRIHNSTGEITTYEWDHRNRLAKVTRGGLGLTDVVGDFVYDIVNRRLTTTSRAQTSRFRYSGSNQWLDAAVNGDVIARYMMGVGIDEVIGRQKDEKGQGWYYTDHLGTVHSVATQSGTVVQTNVYDAYGTLVAQSNPEDADRFLFGGREFDSDSGLYFLRARFYDPSIGRFLSRDPIGFTPGEQNLYAYGYNRPVTERDALGLSPLVGYALQVGRLGRRNVDVDLEARGGVSYSPEEIAGATIGGLHGFGIVNLFGVASVIGNPTGSPTDWACDAENAASKLYDWWKWADPVDIDDNPIPGKGFLGAYYGGIGIEFRPVELEFFDFLEIRPNVFSLGDYTGNDEHSLRTVGGFGNGFEAGKRWFRSHVGVPLNYKCP